MSKLSAQSAISAETLAADYQVCLLLGSNIQPERNLPLAVERLGCRVSILRASSVWETPAVGSRGPNFLNAALLCLTTFSAEALKWRVLRPLEAQLGRVRNADKNAPRPIDFDIITIDGKLHDPILWQYSFRAVPVAELLPDLESESGESLRNAAARLAAEMPVRLRPDITLYPKAN